MAPALSASAVTPPALAATDRCVSSTPLNPISLLHKKSSPPRLEVRASLPAKEKVIQSVAAAAMAAALAVPGIAEAAAQPGMSPSLQNYLLSIASGGVVLAVLLGAVVGVANFDPVKRT